MDDLVRTVGKCVLHRTNQTAVRRATLLVQSQGGDPGCVDTDREDESVHFCFSTKERKTFQLPEM